MAISFGPIRRIYALLDDGFDELPKQNENKSLDSCLIVGHLGNIGKKGDLSPCKKAEVKALVNAKLFSNHKISRRWKVSEASVRSIKKKIESGEELSLKRKKKCGRKPIFTPRSERSLKKNCSENKFTTTKVIKSQLQDIIVNASERTIRRKLKDLNFKTCRPARKPKLTLAMKAKRMNWAKQWHDKDVDFWRSVCFSDESTFEILQNKAQFVRRRRGEKFHSDCAVQTVKHPTKIMIWSVISGKGTGRLLKLEEWFPNGEAYIFMQDGAPCHTTRSIKAVLTEQNIPLLDWSGNSPDMNPIENIWELMKREVAKDVITNKTQLLERIIHV
ncbi:transposable element Tcb2 transposase [Trichonephila clavipes]|uniref:Transposable element Tcb2 transposase n=1 Tax=Trichonephila clavipes TaxID=2585209 RepID=A0A8X6RI09_TRICX|nr:transposable element Tcb2 transposase [Trichonephila clavipes]